MSTWPSNIFLGPILRLLLRDFAVKLRIRWEQVGQGLSVTKTFSLFHIEFYKFYIKYNLFNFLYLLVPSLCMYLV
jgi:hypothetical protein